MTEPLSRRVLGSRWLLVPAVWAVPALLAGAETLVFWRMAGRPFPAWRALATQAPAWLLYAALTPGIFALGRRLPLAGRHAARNVAVHLACALVAGALFALVATAASVAFAPVPSRTPATQRVVMWFLSSLPFTVLAYFGVLGVGHALTYLEQSRQRALEAAQLTAQLAEARLGALRMQLHPHFLFNSLNAVTVLARDGDTERVARMLTDLSELLREVLHGGGTHETTVEAELAFVRRYLDVEQVRFSDRLRVAYDVDASLSAARVPSFVLQPLVENALRHGVARRSDAGRVEIGARRDRATGAVELWVRDDGGGLPDDWSGAEDYGVGLANTAARLAQLYGADASLTLAPAVGGGAVALVRLPLRPSHVVPAAT